MASDHRTDIAKSSVRNVSWGIALLTVTAFVLSYVVIYAVQHLIY